MDLAGALERNDAFPPLLRAGALVYTGPTGTNLLDVHLLAQLTEGDRLAEEWFGAGWRRRAYEVGQTFPGVKGFGDNDLLFVVPHGTVQRQA